MRALAIVIACTLAWVRPAVAEARPPAKAAQLGVLGIVATPNRWESFRQGLGEFGFADRRNLAIVYRPATGSDEQFTAPAAELVHLNVDLIFAVGPAAVRAAHKTTRTIPVVALDLESDPVAAGFVESLARPGRNITGLFLDLPELAGKWRELVRETIPSLSRVAVLWDPGSGPLQLRAIQTAARSLAVELQVLEARWTGFLEEWRDDRERSSYCRLRYSHSGA